MPDFDAHTNQLDSGEYIVSVSGELDLFTAPHLKEAWAEPLNAEGAAIIVDLTNVSFLDSTALGALIGAMKKSRGNNGSLNLVIADESILKTFEVTGLDRVFEIHPSVETALGHTA